MPYLIHTIVRWDSRFEPASLVQDLDTMEYCEDVQHFQEHGHATCAAYAMATGLASDIAHHLKKVCLEYCEHGTQRCTMHLRMSNEKCNRWAMTLTRAASSGCIL